MKTTLRNQLLFFVLFFTTFTPLIAQVELLWQNWHTDLSSGEKGSLVITDANDEIWVVGIYGSITKLDVYGNTLFIIPDTINSFNPVAIKMDHDNKILVLGSYGIDLTGNKSIRLLKFELDGSLIWDLKFNPINGNREFPSAMDIDEGNNIYVTGYKGTQHIGTFYTAKVWNSGSIAWEHNHTGPYLPSKHTGLDICAKDSNNVYAVGFVYVNSSNYKDAYIQKFNNLGNVIWSDAFSYHTWVGQFNMTSEFASKVNVDSLGNVYVLVNKDLGIESSILMKYSSTGNEIWVDEPVPIESNRFSSLIVDNNGVYIGGHLKNSSIGIYNLTSAAKYNFNGDLLWLTSLENNPALFVDMVKHDDGVILSSYTYTCNGCDWDFLCINIDEQGNIVWNHQLSTYNGWMAERPYDMHKDSQGAIIITGQGEGSSNNCHTYKLWDCSNTDASISLTDSLITAPFYPTANYSWIDCGNNNIIFQGSELNVISVPNIGNYKVVVSIGSCADTSTCFAISTGFEELIDLNFKLFPNPTEDLITIQSNSTENQMISLFDLVGNLLDTYTFSSSITFSLKNYSNGYYFIKDEDGHTLKVIKL